MASPRTMWKGSISLGLLNVPITIGKAFCDERDPSLRDVCQCHGLPLEKFERCKVTGERPYAKSKGIAVPDDSEEDGVRWEMLAEGEVEYIKNSTKSDTLAILDIQPLHLLPSEFSTGTYYTRAERGAERAFKLVATALAHGDRAAVVKWCRAARQRLAFLHSWDGVLQLTTIPFYSEWRSPGDLETRHQTAEIDDIGLGMALQLFDEISSPNGFQWDRYQDDGLLIRAEAVERVLNGLRTEQYPVERAMPNLMEALEASLRYRYSPKRVSRRPATRNRRRTRRNVRRRRR